MTQTYHIAEVALRVRDLEASAAFYQDILGFTLHKRMDQVIFLEVGALDTPLGAAGHPALLALFCRDPEVDVARSTFDHIAFEVPADRFEAERARYEARGMVISQRAWPDTLPWRGRAFFFRDPDGNVVEIIAGLEGTREAARASACPPRRLALLQRCKWT